MTRTNRQTRRARDFKSMAAQAWSPWEWHNHLVGHSCALPGMKRCCLNNKYSVQFFEQVTTWGKIDHLVIRRHDEKPNIPWADMQRIKNELVGSDCTGIQVYPDEAKLVDEANCYHLWVLPQDVILPFGLTEGWH